MFDDESAFHAALYADPDNHAIRGVFADWLEERGDRRAHGFRWMVANGKRPENFEKEFHWNNVEWYQIDPPSRIPDKILQAISDDHNNQYYNYRIFDSRQAAEDALAHAIADIREAGKWTPGLDGAGLVAAGEIVAAK